ncbi:MAG TPA: P22 phage major capsid protein family protein [Nitrospiraceae bacterium]
MVIHPEHKVDGSFDGTSGTTLRIRLPDQFTVRKNSWTMAVQAQSEQVVTLTHGTPYGVDLEFNHDEIMFALGNERAWEEISSRKIEPAIAGMISTVEADILVARTKDIYQLTGTAGSVVGASGDTSAVGLARAKLNQQAVPMEYRSVQLDSVTMATIVNGQKAIFNPQADVSKAFREGYYGRAYQSDWYENERTYAHTAGTDHTTVTVNDASIASGDTTITTAGANVTVGTVFTFSGDAVKDVHPETKQSYAHDKQFVITAVNGNDWTFSPAYITTGPLQNVSKLPTTGQAITLHGAANSVLQQNLMYHRDAFVVVNAAPPVLDSAEKCMVKRQENLAFRVWMGSDIVNSRLLLRLDTVFGSLTARPSFACRISN